MWATIDYSSFKGFKNNSGDKIDEGTKKKTIAWGKEAPRKWLEFAKTKYDESVKAYHNGDDGAYEYSWLDACTHALQDSEIKPYVKDWGVERKGWMAKDPKKFLTSSKE